MTDQLEDQTQGGSTVRSSLPGGCMADLYSTKGANGVRAVELNVAARLIGIWRCCAPWSAPSAIFET